MCFLVLEFPAMDKVQNPSNSQCYTPSSEPSDSVYSVRLLIFHNNMHSPAWSVCCVQFHTSEDNINGSALIISAFARFNHSHNLGLYTNNLSIFPHQIFREPTADRLH
jgi:hypothetical protein